MDTKKLPDSYLYHQGNGKTGALILHGFTGNVGELDILFEYLKRKGLTVARPVLPGHSGRKEDLTKFGPPDWLKEARKWLEFLRGKAEEIFIIGVSFGGNLAAFLLAENGGDRKVKGLLFLETPALLVFRIRFLLGVVQPLARLLGFKIVRKRKFLYRGNFQPLKEKYLSFMPVRIAGEVRKFIRQTRRILPAVKVPSLIIQARKSDLLASGNAQYIHNHLSSAKKEIHYVPFNNHNLDLLDDAGKMLLLEKIYSFIKKQSGGRA